MALKLLYLIIFSYLLTLAFLFLFQRSLLYFPSKQYYSPKQIGLDGFEEVKITTEDAFTLRHWYKKPTPENDKVVMFLHGNAGGISDRGFIYKKIADQGFGVFALEYRGYSNNPDNPSEKGLYKDATSAIKWLIKKQNINPKNILLLGESLGTGIAINAATKFDLGGIYLIAPYTSIAITAQHHYPYFPVKYLVKDKFNSIKKISEVKEPVYVFHGENDNIIPPKYGRELFEAADNAKKKEFFLLPDQGHNDYDIDFVIERIKNEVGNSDYNKAEYIN